MLPFALPLLLLGLWLRARGRRRLDTIAAMTPLYGTWRRCRVVERDDGSAVLVAGSGGGDGDGDGEIADGARVLVVGCAAGDADDPRSAGYRGHARIARFTAERVTTDVDALARQMRWARVAAVAGAVLFAAALGIAAFSTVVFLRMIEYIAAT